MKEIKSKPEGGKPKLMDKAAKIPKTAAKDLWLKSKEKSISEIKETPFAGQRGESSNAPANNAGDQILSGTETTAREGASLTYRGGKKLAQVTARKIKEKQEFSRTLSEAKHATGKTMDAAQSAASKIRTKHAAVRTVKGKPQKVVKTAGRSVKSLKQSVKGIKTALEMADEYGFDENQRRQLAELLSDENKELWTQVLYGITGGGSDIVSVALSQVGNVGGYPYWKWYGFETRVEWCACFVSWCANECGYISSGIIPKFAGCTSGGMAWFKEHGQWQERDYVPNPGDIIFFDWVSNGLAGDADHVGIVEKVENGRIYTIEGNSDDSVRQNSYPVGYLEIRGFGCH